jgi:hypothetical protein
MTNNNNAKINNSTVNVEIFAAGDGIHYPKKGHTVTLHYSAFLRSENGQMFDCVSFFFDLLLFACFHFCKNYLLLAIIKKKILSNILKY